MCVRICLGRCQHCQKLKLTPRRAIIAHFLIQPRQGGGCKKNRFRIYQNTGNKENLMKNKNMRNVIFFQLKLYTKQFQQY